VLAHAIRDAPQKEDRRVSNMGDMGDMGDLGNMGLFLAGGGGIAFPDRVDLPFVEELLGSVEAGSGSWAFSRTGDKTADLRLPNRSWTDHDWSARWAAWPIFSDYVRTQDYTGVGKGGAGVTIPDWDPDRTATEIDSLCRDATDERADALGEIVAQDGYYEKFLDLFMTALGVRSGSHGAVERLLHVAGLVGLVVSMYWKANARPKGSARPVPRPRPNQICPALRPPVAVPGHPSYPSGHACQALLMACVAEDMLPRSLRQEEECAYRKLLQTQAFRIARNREIAGLHYRSDTEAGFVLALQVFGQLKQVASYQAAREAARQQLEPGFQREARGHSR